MAASSPIDIKGLIRDRQFQAALIAGPMFWAAFWLYLASNPEWGRSLSSLWPPWPLTAPAQFLLLAVIYPVLEELVFRGALQGWLRSHGWGLSKWGPVTRANVLTSVAFTITHVIMNPVYLSAAVFIPSLIFGYFRDRYDRLHASIVLHVFYNAGYIWLFTGLPTG